MTTTIAAGRAVAGNFIALVIASGQVMSMAADSIRDGSGFKKAALGAAGVVALRLGLRYALGGPLGIILTGAAAVSLAGYLIKNQKEITGKVGDVPDPHRRHPDPVRGGAGGLSRRPLRRRQPQPDGRRPAKALPRRSRRGVGVVNRLGWTPADDRSAGCARQSPACPADARSQADDFGETDRA